MDKSPTEEGSVQSSSDLQNESQLDNDTTNISADEQQQDTDSGENTSSDSDSGSSSNTSNDENQSSDDDGLAKFAKGQGFDDISDFTERELALLRRQKKQVDAYRNDPERIQSKDELRKATEDINDPQQVEDFKDLSEVERREAARDLEIAQLKSAQRTRDFFDSTPEAKEYEAEMAKVILEKKEKYGPAAARLFAQDLSEVYILAKARNAAIDSEAAREAGRREERELLRKRQEGSADTSHATQASTSKSKIDRTWLDTQYDPSNAEHRAQLDEALARGDLY